VTLFIPLAGGESETPYHHLITTFPQKKLAAKSDLSDVLTPHNNHFPLPAPPLKPAGRSNPLSLESRVCARVVCVCVCVRAWCVFVYVRECARGHTCPSIFRNIVLLDHYRRSLRQATASPSQLHQPAFAATRQLHPNFRRDKRLRTATAPASPRQNRNAPPNSANKRPSREVHELTQA